MHKLMRADSPEKQNRKINRFNINLRTRPYS